MDWDCSYYFGRWQKSTFKLPVPILDNFSCSIRHNTKDGRFLEVAKYIIWEECTMTPHHALSTVDRLFTDLTGSGLPFKGKVFVLDGDWRRIFLLRCMRTKELLSRPA
ncbi:hypothetical protein AVEN_138502-1 [Araneus ventricosus]|uniref:ATP-dependent DNA helicase n=1 Tax=Araneus ventricosus TaxID=182803 RepID=A0A4Y2PSM0_ARAVE|nr:hypothetical protein AVEN_138502-1 [Araneus ventricosus]